MPLAPSRRLSPALAVSTFARSLPVAALLLSRRWSPAILLGLSLLVSACGNSPGAPRLSERQIKAQAMFAERCKTAGEKIHKTVENVEGIYVLKLRPAEINRGGQFTLDDPYGSDLSGEGYIVSLLKGSYETNLKPSESSPPPPKGYSFVEAKRRDS